MAGGVEVPWCGWTRGAVGGWTRGAVWLEVLWVGGLEVRAMEFVD